MCPFQSLHNAFSIQHTFCMLRSENDISFRLELIPPKGGVSHSYPSSPFPSVTSVFFLYPERHFANSESKMTTCRYCSSIIIGNVNDPACRLGKQSRHRRK